MVARKVLFTICKLVPLVMLMVFGFVRGSGENPVFTPMLADGLSFGTVLGQLLIAVLFAFEGWTTVAPSPVK